jgi:hypothetical protein
MGVILIGTLLQAMPGLLQTLTNQLNRLAASQKHTRRLKHPVSPNTTHNLSYFNHRQLLHKTYHVVAPKEIKLLLH